MEQAGGWAEVERVIAQGEAGGIVLGVSARRPGGERFSHNGARRFVAASTVKIAIMIELFRQRDAGLVRLDTLHRLRPEDRTTGSGVVSQLHDGIELSLADHAFLMMSISDNASTNILIDRVGMDRVNAILRSLGMAGSTLGRRMRGSHADEAETENWAVPDDYVRAVEALFDGGAGTPAACADMLRLLEAQQNDRRIARHLPREGRPRWGSKTGSLPGVVNDVGFIMTEGGPLILAVFCEDVADPNEGERLIGDIAKALLFQV